MTLDAIESLVGAILGLLTGMVANRYVLPVFGFNPNWWQSLGMALVFFSISFALRFVVRRTFRKIGAAL